MARRSMLPLALAALIILSGLIGCSPKSGPPKSAAFAWGTSAGTGEFAVSPLRQRPAEVWKVALPGNAPHLARPAVVSFSSVVAQDRVFVGTSQGQVHAYDLASGKLLWAYAPAALNPQPAYVDVVADGLVFASVPGKGFVALRASNGRPVWTAASDFWTPTTLAGNLLISACGDGILARNWRTGEEIWRYRDDSSPMHGHGVAAAEGIVCLSGSDALIEAFDAATGQSKWQTQLVTQYDGEASPSATRAGVVTTRPAIAGNLVYVVTTAWQEAPKVGPSAGPACVYALDLATGEVRWQRDLSLPAATGSVARLRTVTAVSRGTVLLSMVADNEVSGMDGNDGALVALDATTGETKWVRDDRVLTNIQAPITTAGETVYVFSRHRDSTIHAVDLTSGTELWAIDTTSMWKNTEVGYPGALYPVTDGLIVALSDGTVRLFR